MRRAPSQSLQWLAFVDLFLKIIIFVNQADQFLVSTLLLVVFQYRKVYICVGTHSVFQLTSSSSYYGVRVQQLLGDIVKFCRCFS